MKWLVLIAATALIAILAYRTRGLIFALLPIILPMFLPAIKRWMQTQISPLGPNAGTGAGTGPRQSAIETEFFHLELDHNSGEIRGRVLKGAMVGRDLSELRREQLAELWRQCSVDESSQSALEAYLDQIWPQWQESAAFADQSTHRQHSANDSRDTDLSTQDALAILGLSAEADREAIISAHRRLMQKVHPDHGGSDYLAERINAAKAKLLATR